jgi:hypothetical protein
MKLAALSCLLAITACAGNGGGDDTGDDTPPAGAPLVTPVGEPTGPATTVEIGPDGGRAASPDGSIAIDIPPGAVAATTAITLQPITSGVPGTIGSAWRLGPEGQTFAVPVTITFAYDPAVIGDYGPDALVVSFHNAEGGWNVVPVTATDAAAHTVSVQSPHFSDWILEASFSLAPFPDTSIATGETLELEAWWCTPDLDNCQDVTAPTCQLECATDIPFGLEWSVNGIAGGTVDDGLIAQVDGRPGAIFTAPNRAPEPNKVQVAARCIEDCSQHGTVIAFTHVTIEDKPYYVGHVNIERQLSTAAGTLSTTSTATVTFAYDVNDGQYHPKSGDLHATYDSADASCSTTTSYDGTLGHDDGLLVFAGTVYAFNGYTPGAVFTGTVTCGTDSEAVTLPLGVAWWANESPAGLEQVGLGGVLEASQTFTQPDGTVVTTDWYLEPIDPDQM